MSLFCSLLLILVIVLLYLCWFFKKSHTYFNDKCFPTLEPTFVLGNLADAILLRKSLAVTVYDLYEKLRPYKYAGLYWLHRPFVMLRDPEMIKNILIRDFAHFPDRGIHCDEKEEPLNNNLIRMGSGDKWKCIRMKISPLFTSGKLKMIIPPVQECANKLSEVIDRTQGEPFDMKELSERFSIDVIGNCAFGMDTSALENPRSPFLKMGKEIFKFRYQPIIRHFFPALKKFWIKIFNLRYIDKEVETFFSNIIHEAIKLREKSQTTKNDLMDSLLALRNDNVDDCANLKMN
ncbi:cytochrome P450 6a9-like [Planococcus citri]|uniref:cytochrome P450 6a9-like n=1 Tax=Planococcus citri TaxID=170843 RepID=UPI0031F7F535